MILGWAGLEWMVDILAAGSAMRRVTMFTHLDYVLFQVQPRKKYRLDWLDRPNKIDSSF